MGGLVQMVPTQLAVNILYSSGEEPQLTNMAGSGYINVPGFQFCFIAHV